VNRIIYFTVICLFFLYPVYGEDLEFFKEDITFKIVKDTFIVCGNYYFKNNTDRLLIRKIYYPIPENNRTITDSTAVYNISKNQRVQIVKNENNHILFELSITPFDVVHYYISYQQKIVCDSVEYILETTKKWQKPLITATYRLIVPIKKTVTAFSYSPHISNQYNGYKIFLWEFQNFMPYDNMVFYLKDIK